MKTLLVETEKIEKNIKLIFKRAKEKKVIAVLKGNGYGLGLVPLASTLCDLGISFFAVTDPHDAIRLREGGLAAQEILVMRSTSIPDEIQLTLRAGAIAAVGSYDAAVALNGMAKQMNLCAKAHIIIDSGMGRYGFASDETDKILSIFRFMDNIEVCGMYTHLNQAFSSAKKSMEQCEALYSAACRVKEAGFNYGMLHAENSAALMRFNIERFDAVRIGSAITGRAAGKMRGGLFRTGRLCADIHEIRWLKKGASVGYGSAFVCRRPTRVAIADAGYADGVLAERARDVYRFRDCVRYCLSDIKRWISGSGNYVMINGKRAPVIGHVGMAHTAIDVTDIQCEIGDSAIFEVSPVMVDSAIERKYI